MPTSESLCRFEAGSGVRGWVSEVEEALDSRRVLAREVVEALGFCRRSSSMSNLRFVVARAGSCGGGGEDAICVSRVGVLGSFADSFTMCAVWALLLCLLVRSKRLVAGACKPIQQQVQVDVYSLHAQFQHRIQARSGLPMYGNKGACPPVRDGSCRCP